jgi:DNA-binding response OmpR family regulator
MNPTSRHDIAVIDDDEEFTRFVERYLAAVGHRVRGYISPQEFLAEPEALCCDIFLVDLMLPGLDGIDLVSMIRASGEAGIIVVSGRMGPDAFTTALAAGADMFINKPVRADQLAQAIASLSRRLGEKAPPAAAGWILNLTAGALMAPSGDVIKLGQLEQRILAVLAQYGEKGCNRSDLAKTAQVAPSADDRNLDAAMFRLRRKIETRTGKTSPVLTLHGKGYALSSPMSVVGIA